MSRAPALMVLAALAFPDLALAAGVGRSGEVLIVEGDDTTVVRNPNGTLNLTASGLQALAKRVIAEAGDKFQSITVWTTFDPRGDGNSVAFELTVKNDVLGLGAAQTLRDSTADYGSAGTLRSIVNMQALGLSAGDTRDARWENNLSTWGQEFGHRWMAFMRVRDPRTGQPSDALLGRDCAHYSMFVHTDASVHDGFAWTDLGNGMFARGEFMKRFGPLDLYGMGLMPPDEVPPFFFIDDVVGYTRGNCGNQYDTAPKPNTPTVRGKRIDVTIDDIIAINGDRVPSADEPGQDYYRDVEVVLTTPSEQATSTVPRTLAARIDRARLWFEEWVRAATRNRLVVCTQSSADCGDTRSDVGRVVVNPERSGPDERPTTFEAEVSNGGVLAATGIKASIEIKIGDKLLTGEQTLGDLAAGATTKGRFALDLRGVACGTEGQYKVVTQSDRHRSRQRGLFLVGVESASLDGFETDSGWQSDPDATDTAKGARWERGTPERALLLGTVTQPAGAHAGQSAWVTGAAAVSAGYARAGTTTLQSPPLETAGLRRPMLRYWVSFSGVRAGPSGNVLEPSPESRLEVFARAADAGGAWLPLDALSNTLTKGWVQRAVHLPASLSGARVQLRFVATDANPASGGVEAAIDDVELVSMVAGCDAPGVGSGFDAGVVRTPDGGTPALADGGGCGCHTVRAPAAPAGWLVIAAVALFIRRRRR